ncbi:hypothetical protein BJX62DRAFT_245712 [Aspergillus germanicus]
MPLRHFNMWLCTRWQEPDESTDINWPLIDTSVIQTAAFKAACAGLQSFAFGRLIDRSETRGVNIVIPLLKAATILRRLSLYLDEGSHSLAFLDHLLSAGLKCPLEEISIEAAPLGSGESPRIFLAQHKGTLKQLRLRTIFLDKGAWSNLLDDLRVNFKSLGTIALDRCMQAANEKYLHFDGIAQRARKLEGSWHHSWPVWRARGHRVFSTRGRIWPRR